jgi:putative membrane protein
MILRDELAIQRTQLANQRTLLAFIGTVLQFIIVGITFSKLEVFDELQWMSIPLYVIALTFLIIGVFNFRRNHKRIMGSYSLQTAE